MAIYSFQHDYISVKRHGHGRAAAGVRYITRPSSENVVYIGFDPNRFVARRQMQDIEDASPRKDSRIAHTFIVALPRECNAEQRKDLAENFGWVLTKNHRAPAILSIHMDKEWNPHLHCYLVDRAVTFHRDERGRYEGVELGPSVQKLTHSKRERMQMGLEPNATEALRTMWEKVCNASMESYGIEARIDRRTLLEQGLDRKPEKHRGVEREDGTLDANSNEDAQTQVERLSGETNSVERSKSEIPIDNAAPESPELPGDEEPPDVPDGLMVREKTTPLLRVKDALESDGELQHLRHVKTEIERTRAVKIAAEREAAALQEQVQALDREIFRATQAISLVEADLSNYQRPDGKLRGFHVKVWRYSLYKSPKRERGEALTIEKGGYEYRKAVKEREANDKAYKVAVLQKDIQDAVNQHEAAKRELDRQVSLYGNAGTLDEAERILSRSIENELSQTDNQVIYAQFENGELSGEEALRVFELKGEPEMAEAVRQRMGIEEEQEEGMEI